jgi:hypothetical protein
MLHSKDINTDIWQVSCEKGWRLAGDLVKWQGLIEAAMKLSILLLEKKNH